MNQMSNDLVFTQQSDESNSEVENKEADHKKAQFNIQVNESGAYIDRYMFLCSQ